MRNQGEFLTGVTFFKKTRAFSVLSIFKDYISKSDYSELTVVVGNPFIEAVGDVCKISKIDPELESNILNDIPRLAVITVSLLRLLKL